MSDQDEAEQNRQAILLANQEKITGLVAQFGSIGLLVKAGLMALVLLLVLQVVLSYTIFRPACTAYAQAQNMQTTQIEYISNSGKKTRNSSFSGSCEYKLNNGDTKRVRFGDVSSWKGILSIFFRFDFGILVCLLIVFAVYVKPRLSKKESSHLSNKNT